MPNEPISPLIPFPNLSTMAFLAGSDDLALHQDPGTVDSLVRPLLSPNASCTSNVEQELDYPQNMGYMTGISGLGTCPFLGYDLEIRSPIVEDVEVVQLVYDWYMTLNTILAGICLEIRSPIVR